jgi:polyhydroxyalkanoate synthesis regulator phasin
MTDQEKERSEWDQFRAPKMREVRVTTQEARDAIDELIGAAKKQNNRTIELLAVVLQRLIQGEESLARDLEYIRNRVDAIEKNIQSPSRG